MSRRWRMPETPPEARKAGAALSWRLAVVPTTTPAGYYQHGLQGPRGRSSGHIHGRAAAKPLAAQRGSAGLSISIGSCQPRLLKKRGGSVKKAPPAARRCFCPTRFFCFSEAFSMLPGFCTTGGESCSVHVCGRERKPSRKGQHTTPLARTPTLMPSDHAVHSFRVAAQ